MLYIANPNLGEATACDMIRFWKLLRRFGKCFGPATAVMAKCDGKWDLATESDDEKQHLTEPTDAETAV